MSGKVDPASRATLEIDLRQLGVAAGDLVMVHASLKAVGPVDGGPATIVDALRDVVGESGTLLAYVSWDRSPYDETRDKRQLTPAQRKAWPAFVPDCAGVYPGFGRLNEFVVAYPGSERSAHPDASMAAIGRDAAWLVADHRFGDPYGPGSPLGKFLECSGKVLLLGAPLDAVTILHFAESVADIPNKRRVAYELPVIDAQGQKAWIRTVEFDSNGILDCYAQDGKPDAVEAIASEYVELGRHRCGRVGRAQCHLFDALDLVEFGKRWLEARHGPSRHLESFVQTE